MARSVNVIGAECELDGMMCLCLPLFATDCLPHCMQVDSRAGSSTMTCPCRYSVPSPPREAPPQPRRRRSRSCREPSSRRDGFLGLGRLAFERTCATWPSHQMNGGASVPRTAIPTPTPCCPPPRRIGRCRTPSPAGVRASLRLRGRSCDRGAGIRVGVGPAGRSGERCGRGPRGRERCACGTAGDWQFGIRPVLSRVYVTSMYTNLEGLASLRLRGWPPAAHQA